MYQDREEPADDLSQEWVSKSQKKRDSKEIQKFVESLTKLPKAEYQTFPLTEDILGEFENLLTIRSHIARSRQVKFVARLIRDAGIFPELKTKVLENKARKRLFKYS